MALRVELGPFHEDPAVTGAATLVLNASARPHSVPDSGSQRTSQ